MERTFVMVKPDGVHRGLMGEVVARFERKGLVVQGAKLLRVSEAQAKTHYAEHEGKPFYPSLLEFVTNRPVLALVIAGPRAISVVRKLMGKTFGFDAEPGTIRGDFGASKSYNLCHGSDSPESAAREIAIYFNANEIVDYEREPNGWFFHAEDRA